VQFSGRRGLVYVIAVWPQSAQRGDHVEWNSEAGRVRGTVIKKIVSDVTFKGRTHIPKPNNKN
jgi:hypothetical protein